MSKAKDTFTLLVSLDAAHAACVAAADAGGWKVHDSAREHFYLRQRISLFDRFYRYPSDCAVFLRREKAKRTRVELHGRIMGFGPLQRRRVINAVASLRAGIEAASQDGG